LIKYDVTNKSMISNWRIIVLYCFVNCK